MSEQTWWRVHRGYPGVVREPVRVTKSTEHSVWIEGVPGRAFRVAKKSEYNMYFPTEAEAVEYLLERARAKAKNAQRELQEARSAIGELEAWRRANARNADTPESTEG